MKFIRNIIAEKAGMIDADPDLNSDLKLAFADKHPDDFPDVDADQFDLLADTNSVPDPSPTSPESNSEAVVRPIYHPGPPLSEAAVAKLDLAAARATQEAGQKARREAARKSIQEQADQERPISAFQKIMQRETALPQEEDVAPTQHPEPATPVARSAPTKPRPDQPVPARQTAGRVKTRLLGFGNDFGREPDLFAAGETAAPAPQINFPVGWMVIVSGPGRGTAFTLFDGVSQIGRGEDQAVRLDFGDTSISRSNHAAIAYDPEQQNFYLGHGGKANLVRLNGNPVLSTEPLGDGAEIRLGETTLRFVGLCGPAFDWGKTAADEGDNAQFD